MTSKTGKLPILFNFFLLNVAHKLPVFVFILLAESSYFSCFHALSDGMSHVFIYVCIYGFIVL